MLERLKSLWLALRRHLGKQSGYYVKGTDRIDSDCFYCRHYYDKKCSGRYAPKLICRNFERLK